MSEVRGTKAGWPITYRVGTLTCKRGKPTGLAAAIAAVWLAEGRIKPGVHLPETVVEPEPFFKELEAEEIYTQVSVSSML